MNYKYLCKNCGDLLSSSFRLKEHMNSMHQRTIESAESSLVIVNQNKVEATSNAKIALIREQKAKINHLESELVKSKSILKELRLKFKNKQK